MSRFTKRSRIAPIVATLTVLAFAPGPTAMAAPAPTAEQIAAARSYHEASGGQGLVILHDGQRIHESYANGGNANTQVLLASGTKGFTGLFGAMAAEDGLYRLDDPVAEVVSEWSTDPRRSRITWRHLLTMTSGLEDLKDQQTWEDFLRAPAVAEPGSLFDYGSAPNVFGAALQRKLGTETVTAYLQRRLFGPLGIAVSWRGNFADGNPQLSGGAYVRTREWANLGELVRLGGRWNGSQLIAPELLGQVMSGTAANPAYGLYWWLNRDVPEALSQSAPQFERHILSLTRATFLPDDFTMAAGAYEQRLYVIPSLQLVVARNGPRSAGGRFDDTQFLSRLLPAQPPRNHTGIYMSPTEPGWGVSVAQFGDLLLPVWFTYGADGTPEWMMADALRVDAEGNFHGPLLRWSGRPTGSAVPVVPAERTVETAGTVSLRFGADRSLDYTVQLTGEASRSRRMVPIAFSGSGPSCTHTSGSRATVPNLTDLWWNPEQSGWGLSVLHQGSQLFVAWYSYDSDGSPAWLTAQLERQPDGSFRGAINRAVAGTPYNRESGQPATALPLPAIGEMTLRAVDGERATLESEIAGVRTVQPIRRFSAVPPPRIFCSD